MIAAFLRFIKKYCSHYHGLSSDTWKNLFISFIESTLVGINSFLSIYFVYLLKFTVAETGMLMAVYGAGTILGGVSGGKLSDKITPKFVCISGIIIQAIAYLLLIKMQSKFFLALNLFLLGSGSYIFITSNYVWTLSQCKNNQRFKAINLLGVSSNLGLAVSGILIGFTTIKHFPYIFAISSCLLIITAFFSLKLEAANLQSESHNQAAENNSSSLSQLKVFYFTLFSLFVTGCLIFQMSSTYSIYVKHIFPNMGNKSVGMLFTLNAILVVILQTPFSNVLEKYNQVRLIGLGCFLIGFGLLLLNFAWFYWIAILSCLLMTTGEMMFFPCSQLICYECAPANKKGQNIGIYRTIYASSRVFGPAIGSLIYEHLYPQTLWYTCFFIGIIPFGISFWFERKHWRSFVSTEKNLRQ